MADQNHANSSRIAAGDGAKPHPVRHEIAQWLGSSDLHRLLEAIEALDGMGPEADELLQSLLRNDLQRVHVGKRRFQSLSLLAVLLALLIFWGNAQIPGLAGTVALVLLFPAWLAAPFAVLWHDAHRTRSRRLKHTAALLERRQSLVAVGALTETMALADNETSFQAATCLSQLLPRITSADGALLDARQRVHLQRALRGCNATLILAALDAFEQIGDARDIHAVRRLTACPEWIIDCYRIRARAKACLAVLEARAKEQRAGGTFLRAATAPSSENLLRAAKSPEDADPQQLLRAEHGELRS
jgi:hypothetical protein